IVVGLDLGAALPVELTTFTGNLNDGEVDLNWTTALEINTDKFVVERAVGNGGFAAIGEVAAAGNSDTPQSYTFTDANPEVGENQYRLRIVDLDATESFSTIVSVTVENTNRVAVVRNGINTYRLSGARLGTAYLLTDAAGTVLRRGTVTAETQDIDGAGLPTGVYFLVVQEGGTNQSFKLVLQ
ncbi:MAG: T9SS type A sorting domain-containing protein, partial [Bacteroidota bacterium]